MTSPTLTLNDAIGQLKPLINDDFLRTWRKVGMIVGYRNLGRALSAIAPRKGTVKGNVGAQAAELATCPKCSERDRKRFLSSSERSHLSGKRNPAGGLMCANPGGYERQWGRLVGVGLARSPKDRMAKALERRAGAAEGLAAS